MKKKILLIALSLLLLGSAFLQAQTIAPYFFGQNAWEPDSIGSRYWNGTLMNHFQQIKDSHFTSVRIGGKQYDKDSTHNGPPTTHQLLKLIDSIQLNGGEPIIQVDFADSAYTPTQAAAVVTAINVTNLSSIQRKIKYWIIGNEPDKSYTNYNTDLKISSYIKTYSKAMKIADSTILIIAPELSSYNLTRMTAFVGGSSDITGLIPGHTYYYSDLISFHYYPFGKSSNIATRKLVDSTITDAFGFKSQLDGLNGLINTANTSRSAHPLKIAITEANINYVNPSDTSLSGLSANSFVAGQFWAEIMSACMQDSVQILNFWSVIEGNADSTDIGYLRVANATKRSTWHHFALLAKNFKGTYCNGIVSTTQTDVKVFGSYNSDQVAVMIIKEHGSGTSYPYNLRLDGGGFVGSNVLKMKLTCPSINKEYNDTIEGASTTLLVFDHYGNITTKTRYKLSDNYSAPPNLCSTPKTYANQSALNTVNVPGGVYSTITIGGTGSGAITIDSTYNTVFKAAGTITIDGTGGLFSTGTSSMDLINTDCE